MPNDNIVRINAEDHRPDIDQTSTLLNDSEIIAQLYKRMFELEQEREGWKANARDARRLQLETERRMDTLATCGEAIHQLRDMNESLTSQIAEAQATEDGRARAIITVNKVVQSLLKRAAASKARAVALEKAGRALHSRLGLVFSHLSGGSRRQLRAIEKMADQKLLLRAELAAWDAAMKGVK